MQAAEGWNFQTGVIAHLIHQAGLILAVSHSKLT